MVFVVLAKYYGVTRDATAAASGTDHGSVSYHILKHNSRYKNNNWYANTYDKLLEQLFDTNRKERQIKIESLINQL